MNTMRSWIRIFAYMMLAIISFVLLGALLNSIGVKMYVEDEKSSQPGNVAYVTTSMGAVILCLFVVIAVGTALFQEYTAKRRQKRLEREELKEIVRAEVLEEMRQRGNNTPQE